MTPDLWGRVDALFRAAMALKPADRAAFLARRSGEDPAVVAEVARLIEHDLRAERDWAGLAASPLAGPEEPPAPPEGGLTVRLRVTDGPHRGESFVFDRHDMFVVGRSPQAHFRLPIKDKTLSRFQFLVEVNPPRCRVMDMASTNGTRVNGRKTTTADLRDGDVIRAGKTTFAVTIEGAGGPASSGGLQAEAAGTGTGAFEAPAEQAEPPLADAPAFEEPTPQIPGYSVGRKLGEGGMGVVYLARADDGAEVAIKMITPAAVGSSRAVARFLREASILRQLDHPNIVRFQALGQAGGRIFFAMDHVPGTDAGTLIERRGPLSIGQAARVAAMVLEGLGYAHAKGFVHRDIKPPNLLLGKVDGRTRLKLADFGLARIYQNSPLSGLTLTGHVAGTVGFMPPEQITDFREAKPSADQYAAGATLYYLLTARKIYDFPTHVQGQLVKILTEEPVPIRARRPEVPEGLEAVIHRSLARDPARRFPDVDAMRRALEPFLSEP